MKKKILIVAAVLAVAAIALVGFIRYQTAEKEKFTINFWSPLTGDDGAYMDQIVKEFNEQSDSEYTINHVITSDMYTKLSTVVSSKSGIPDLTLMHSYKVEEFVNSGIIDTVDSLISYQPELQESNYLDTAWNAGNVNGTQYTIPLDIHASAMYYNSDLLEKYGVTSWLDDNIVTFDEMMSLSGKLDEGDYIVNNALLSWVLLAQIRNLGGDISDEAGNPTVNTPEMKEALEKIKALTDAGLMTPYGEDGYLMFQGGNVLLSTDGTWTSTAHDAVEGLNWGVTNIYSTSSDIATNRAASHMFGMLNSETRTDEKEEVIAQFLEFVRTNSIEWAKAGQIVASNDILESEEYKQYPQSFFTSTPEEEETLYIFDYVYFSYVLEALDVYCTDIAYGELDMDEGLATMQQYVEDKIAEVAK
ncbi:extracellular solute-binding protein [Enterococcus sp.]|uniref:extracellular solute-binding protein n=2 Tax=Enterococcus sp. TaxID=35783 RepID=UPI0028988F1B|nr:extracellular solute-binding protein [Enterococcus sp.]